MLERLRFRDFQRHEDFRVVFDERVTTFVGTSDAGKSSILRALRWAMTNRPSGSAFVRHGAKEAVVTLWLDGSKLQRRKGKGVNEIVLDGASLEAFGAEFPEPVRLLCNVDDANFQGQHDLPFWLSLTAGQASRELNTVVNLDEIDRVLSAVLQEERKAKTETELCERRVEEAERECKALGWVPEMEAEWQEAEQEQKKLDDAEVKLSRARGLLEEVERLRERAKVEVPDTRKLDAAIIELRKAVERVRELRLLIDGIDLWKKRIVEADERILELQSELDERSGGICPLCGGRL